MVSIFPLARERVKATVVVKRMPSVGWVVLIVVLSLMAGDGHRVFSGTQQFAIALITLTNE